MVHEQTRAGKRRREKRDASKSRDDDVRGWSSSSIIADDVPVSVRFRWFVRPSSSSSSPPTTIAAAAAFGASRRGLPTLPPPPPPPSYPHRLPATDSPGITVRV